MANPRQRHKQRTSRTKLTRRTGDKLKKVQIKGSAIIAAHWDKTQTLQQNYKRLGLVADPNHNPNSGGTEKLYPSKSVQTPETDEQGLRVDEAIIKRDTEGNVVDIIYSTLRKDTEPTTVQNTPVVDALEQRATETIKTVREPSASEIAWLQKIVRKYGEDYNRAAKDARLNPMQQTAADIKRRIAKIKAP